MEHGLVKWFNSSKGYGFIVPDSGSKDIFVHASALEKSGIKNLQDGQAVSYEVENNNGKDSAINLQLK